MVDGLEYGGHQQGRVVFEREDLVVDILVLVHDGGLAEDLAVFVENLYFGGLDPLVEILVIGIVGRQRNGSVVSVEDRVVGPVVVDNRVDRVSDPQEIRHDRDVHVLAFLDAADLAHGSHENGRVHAGHDLQRGHRRVDKNEGLFATDNLDFLSPVALVVFGHHRFREPLNLNHLV